jgi:L,D-transpeptidase catalytic domain
MTRRLTPLAALLGALALAGPAAALPPGPTGPTGPSGPPAPAEAKMAIGLHTGIVDRGVRWVLAGDRLLVRGHIDPFVKGEKVQIELSRSGKLISTRIVNVKPYKGTKGKFQIRFPINRDAVYSVIARHLATAQQKFGKSKRQHFRAIPARVSGEESTRLLQIGLQRLAFVSPLSGQLDEGTRRAVLAWRKVNYYHHNSSPNSTVFRRVFNGEGGFRLKYGDPAMHVEGDLSRQVLVLAENNRPVQIYTMSSGKPSTPTIRGRFQFYRRQPGTNAHGMVWSTYFQGGYAVHGYPSVPATYPASHGCLRVPIPDSYRIYRSVRLGETIYVYK